MRLLVTGAGGMLAADVIAAARRVGHEVVSCDRSRLDVTARDAVRAVLHDARPDAVVNCAAFTDVDGAESEPARAAAVNALGAGHVAGAAAEVGARTLHVSTDYVFDGCAGRPYVESDAPAPLSVYGQSKRDGELAVRAAHPDALVVRSSWLFGAAGRNFVAKMLGLARDRGELRVVADQIGSPTWTAHLASALVELACAGEPGIHHVAGTGACSWHELCVAALELAGIDVPVVAVTTAEFPRPAPRPACSALASERPGTPRLPPWRAGVAGYLAARATSAAGAPR